MPSELTAHCYCGEVKLFASAPITAAYCHCKDCKRWTGAPLPAFATCAEDSVQISGQTKRLDIPNGIRRWTCARCGSPMMATFPYLPEQAYIPLGVIDETAALAPELHCHAASQEVWLHIQDDLTREPNSARRTLNKATP